MFALRRDTWRWRVRYRRERVKTKDGGYTPLHWCAGKGRLELARALIEAGADVNAKRDGGYTPLHWCAEKGHLERASLDTGGS